MTRCLVPSFALAIAGTLLFPAPPLLAQQGQPLQGKRAYDALIKAVGPDTVTVGGRVYVAAPRRGEFLPGGLSGGYSTKTVQLPNGQRVEVIDPDRPLALTRKSAGGASAAVLDGIWEGKGRELGDGRTVPLIMELRTSGGAIKGHVAAATYPKPDEFQVAGAFDGTRLQARGQGPLTKGIAWDRVATTVDLALTSEGRLEGSVVMVFGSSDPGLIRPKGPLSYQATFTRRRGNPALAAASSPPQVAAKPPTRPGPARSSGGDRKTHPNRGSGPALRGEDDGMNADSSSGRKKPSDGPRLSRGGAALSPDSSRGRKEPTGGRQLAGNDDGMNADRPGRIPGSKLGIIVPAVGLGGPSLPAVRPPGWPQDLSGPNAFQDLGVAISREPGFPRRGTDIQKASYVFDRMREAVSQYGLRAAQASGTDDVRVAAGRPEIAKPAGTLAGAAVGAKLGTPGGLIGVGAGAVLGGAAGYFAGDRLSGGDDPENNGGFKRSGLGNCGEFSYAFQSVLGGAGVDATVIYADSQANPGASKTNAGTDTALYVSQQLPKGERLPGNPPQSRRVFDWYRDTLHRQRGDSDRSWMNVPMTPADRRKSEADTDTWLQVLLPAKTYVKDQQHAVIYRP